jgi:hypothetical protein
VRDQTVAVAVLALLAVVAVVVPLLISSKRRRIVNESSAALAELRRLNDNFQQRLRYPGPITYDWEDRVNSKAQLERYDLKKFLLERLSALENQLHRQITAHVQDVSVYGEYRDLYQRLGSAQLVARVRTNSTPRHFRGSSRSFSPSEG